MATKPLSLALGYAMEVAVGSGDIVRTAESDFTDERGFGNSIRVLGAWRLGSGSNMPWIELMSWCFWEVERWLISMEKKMKADAV
jgi:hypothetical protein